MRTTILIAILLASAFAPAQAQLAIINGFPNLSFAQPTDIQHAPDGSNRLFVSELGGSIWVFANDPAVTSASRFLDLTGLSFCCEGLIGFCFDPDYVNNGYLYAHATLSGPNRSSIIRYSVSPSNPDTAIVDSAFTIIEVAQPSGNHNGGAINFGPDGYLYIPFGDGGSQHDPNQVAQNPLSMLGKILRLDVHATTMTTNYAIPLDNPFVAAPDTLDEIYAIGFRNPWRSSFDPLTGDLWVGDVGQDAQEEIDRVVAAGNYGWDIIEGDSCHEPLVGCDTTGLKPPVWIIPHALGNSITGGYVYRGNISSLWGDYIYGDWGSGRIWALSYDGVGPTSNVELFDLGFQVVTWGVDELGELYLADFASGTIRKLISQNPTGIGEVPSLDALRVTAAPNPFAGSTVISYQLDQVARVSVTVYDVRGRKVATLLNPIEQLPGEHRIEFNSSLAPGVYFAKIEANGVTRTAKLVHVK